MWYLDEKPHGSSRHFLERNVLYRLHQSLQRKRLFCLAYEQNSCTLIYRLLHIVNEASTIAGLLIDVLPLKRACDKLKFNFGGLCSKCLLTEAAPDR